MDWLAFGLPVEGRAAGEPTAGSLARRDAPTCRLDERLGDLSLRLAPGWTWCTVVNETGIVLGRVRRRQVDQHPEACAGDAMEAGPSTYRPSVPASELIDAMKKGHFESALVTDGDGRFLGLVSRQDLEAASAG
jgi:CBS domain-containing protein